MESPNSVHKINLRHPEWIWRSQVEVAGTENRWAWLPVYLVNICFALFTRLYSDWARGVVGSVGALADVTDLEKSPVICWTKEQRGDAPWRMKWETTTTTMRSVISKRACKSDERTTRRRDELISCGCCWRYWGVGRIDRRTRSTISPELGGGGQPGSGPVRSGPAASWLVQVEPDVWACCSPSSSGQPLTPTHRCSPATTARRRMLRLMANMDTVGPSPLILHSAATLRYPSSIYGSTFRYALFLIYLQRYFVLPYLFSFFFVFAKRSHLRAY